ncbi:MAG: sulfur carrier protein ThiS [Acidobacteria bacterium]|nr:sulfur carrier protein ThiS [Acidobacteriota bacterium]
MLLVINGEERQFAESMPVAQLLEALGMKADRVAVEVNREIVPRARWAGTQLCDGDRLEIVHFVGGGNAFAIS